MNIDQQTKVSIIWIGIISCWLFFVLEIVTDFWFGSKFPGYNWQQESISYLGQSNSPVEQWVMIWGVIFCVLLVFYAISFYQSLKSQNWVRIAVACLVTYAIGEGLGSGIFPINPPNTPVTIDARLHNIFSGIGDAGLILFPFVLMLIFPKKDNYRFHLYLWSVVVIGIIMASLFLAAKYYHPDNSITQFKGVWQRVYLLNYHSLLLVVSFKMIFLKTNN